MGTITASCGHVLTDEEGIGISVISKGESIDHDAGRFVPALVYSQFCRACEEKWRADGLLFASEAEADEWLDSANP